MTELSLKLAIDRTPYTEALFDGSVRSERVSLDFVEVKPITRAFRRMARELEFDACEMALATLAVSHRFGIALSGLPAILLREYPMPNLVCLKSAPLESARDLRGRRIAVRSYSQTTAVWVRGILEAEYGVPASEVTWLTQEDSHVSELGVQPFEAPLGEGVQLYDALAGGLADAAVTLHLGSHPDIRKVVPDVEAAGQAWFAQRQAQPVNHLLVVKSDLLREHGWLAAELSTLFERARRHGREQDPAPWNRQGAALLLDFCARQGLTPTAYAPETLIAGG
jgi:4,5-dihydroxyphthalate decarboxylase